MLEHRDSTGYVRTYPTMFGLPYWALLCYSDTLMDVNVGKVICRQTKGLFLGRISKGKLPTNYRGSYYSGSIRCKGDEMSISQCTTRMVKVLWCLNGYARVDCSSCECAFLFFHGLNCYPSMTIIIDNIIHICNVSYSSKNGILPFKLQKLNLLVHVLMINECCLEICRLVELFYSGHCQK